MWIYFILGLIAGSIVMKIVTRSKFVGTMHVLEEEDGHFQCYMTITKEQDITSLKDHSIVSLEVRTDNSQK